MFEKANEYAKAEDAVTASKQSGPSWKPKNTPATGGGGSNNHKDRKRKPEGLVATAAHSSRQRSRTCSSELRRVSERENSIKVRPHPYLKSLDKLVRVSKVIRDRVCRLG